MTRRICLDLHLGHTSSLLKSVAQGVGQFSRFSHWTFLMHRRHSKHVATWLVGAIVAVAVAVVAVSVLLVGAHTQSPTAAANPPPTTPQGKPEVEMVTAASPAPGESGVSPDTLISLKLSAPLASEQSRCPAFRPLWPGPGT